MKGQEILNHLAALRYQIDQISDLQVREGQIHTFCYLEEDILEQMEEEEENAQGLPFELILFKANVECTLKAQGLQAQRRDAT